LIGDPDSLLLLAEQPGRLVACCHLRRESRSTAYFGLFAVRPAEQGSGFGHALLEEARRVAANWGCSTVRMTVIRQRDDLIAWYARRGFLLTGETAPFPYGDERFGRPLRPDLEFVVLEGPSGPQRPE
jgi:GNAT superfamily N-acetyltransferase